MSLTFDEIKAKHKQLFGHWGSSVSTHAPVSAGTQVKLPKVWGEMDAGHSNMHDIEFTLETEMIMIDVLIELERRALEALSKEGVKELQPYTLKSIKADDGALVFFTEEW